MILVWFKNDYRGRLTSKYLTDHREGLIWTASRICGVRWKGQCRKPGLSSLTETAMNYGPLCQTRRMSCFVYALHSTNNWVHDKTNDISGRSRRVLDFLLKKSISENSPFKGKSINFNFLWVGAIIRRSQWPGGLQPLACWDCGFESHREHGSLSFVSGVCSEGYC